VELPGLWFTDWDRSDVLADLHQALFSRNGPHAHVRRPAADRTRSEINATDLQSGAGSSSATSRFDELNSDLSKYPDLPRSPPARRYRW
jgi:hypothetical protein